VVREELRKSRWPNIWAFFKAVTLVLIVVGTIGVVRLFISVPFITAYYIIRAEHAAAEGHQMWPEEVDRLLIKADAYCSSKDAFIARLCRSKEPSIRAEAIIFMERYPDTATPYRIDVLSRDLSINQFMETNAETLARKISQNRNGK
jgi:hypothetical protein